MSEDSEGSLEINKMIHEPARLKIMTYLYVVEEADVLFLKRKTGLTWGNLSSHMSKLEQENYVEVNKEIRDKKVHTTLRLTDYGRKSYEEYRQVLLEILMTGD